MNNLSPLIPLLLCALIGCSAPYESVLALEEIHRSPGEGETCITRQNRAVLRYAQEVFSDSDEDLVELEDPVSYCRDLIEEIGDADLSSPRMRGAAVYILAFTAVRSPSSLVRSEAYQALREICESDAKHFDAVDPNRTHEEWSDLCDRWLTLWGDLPPQGITSTLPGVEEIKARRDQQLKSGRIESSSRGGAAPRARENEEEGTGIASAEQIAGATPLLEEFGGIVVNSASIAWESLALLTVHRPPGAGWVDEKKLYAKAVDSLIGQTFFLSTCESVFDESPALSLLAADGLFLFDFDDMGSLLRLRMERCYDPPLRMLILKNLVALRLAPDVLGGKLMSAVRESLDFRDPGVVYHAVKLFRASTGISENDPSFWREWWSEHVVEFADG